MHRVTVWWLSVLCVQLGDATSANSVMRSVDSETQQRPTTRMACIVSPCDGCRSSSIAEEAIGNSADGVIAAQSRSGLCFAMFYITLEDLHELGWVDPDCKPRRHDGCRPSRGADRISQLTIQRRRRRSIPSAAVRVAASVPQNTMPKFACT